MAHPGIPLRETVISAIKELEQGNLEIAQKLLEQCVTSAPREPVPLYLLGTVKYRCGRYAEAENHFKRALDISPGQPDACFHLAQTLRKLKRPEEAVHFCREALIARHDFVDAAIELAMAHADSGDTESAENQYRRILAKGFNLTAVLNLTTLLNQRDSFFESEAILRTSLQAIEYA